MIFKTLNKYPMKLRKYSLLTNLVAFLFCLFITSCNEEISYIEYGEGITTRSGVNDCEEDNTCSYYWLGGEKISIVQEVDKYVIMYFKEDEISIQKSLKEKNVVTSKSEDFILSEISFKTSDKIKNSSLLNRKIRTTTLSGSVKDVSNILSKSIYYVPCYKFTNGQEVKFSNLLYVKLKSKNDFSLLEKTVEKFAIQILGESKSIEDLYFLACSDNNHGNAIEIANQIHESGFFEYASPSITGGQLEAAINEPLYASGGLWHLGNNLTNPYVHIDYCEGLKYLLEASPSVKVAIIDSGVDFSHRDLYNVLPGWDAETGITPNVVTHSHGTSVAGFICAIPNNKIDVAGIAYGATVLPISISVNSLGNIISADYKMVQAIEYAVDNGAKIINCSWTYESQIVGDAIKNALDKECIVVFASGNKNGSVSYPANSDSRIIVVGAVNKNGNRASFSNYGSNLDVVAPGEDVCVLTPQNSISTGSGTSFAAPQVSALAAMILSKNPKLTAKEVSDVIFKSTKKINSATYPYSFTSTENPSWNNQMGYGLISLENALETLVMAGKPTEYTVSVTIRNKTTYLNPTAFRVDLEDSGYAEIYGAFSEQNALIYTNGEFTTTCKIPAGNYVITAYSEMDSEICDFEFTNINGGEVVFEYNGDYKTWSVAYTNFTDWRINNDD